MTHAGFDIDQYPGDEVMASIKNMTNLEFVCFYLAPAPSHRDTGWMTKRSVLAGQGWGFLPTYVGQETVGPGSHAVNGHQGLMDGTDAANLMMKAGFPAGSWVYLDLENGPPMTPDQKAYVRAWVGAVHIHGYQAGVYVSHLLASEVAALCPGVRIWIVQVSTVNPHPVSGTDFSTETPPQGAFAWQHDQSANVLIAGQHLQVDLDTALSADPSK